MHTYTCMLNYEFVTSLFLFLLLLRNIVPSFLLVAVKKHWPKAIWVGKCLFGLRFHVVIHHWGKPKFELQAGTQADTTEERCFIGLLLLACCFLSETIQDHLPSTGIAHHVLKPITSIINEEKALRSVWCRQFLICVFLSF